MTTQTPPMPQAAPPPPPPAPSARSGARTALLAIALVVAFIAVSLAALAVALTVSGSGARHSASSSTTFEGVRSVDVDVSAEAVEVVAGQDATTRLDRTTSWSLRRPSTSARLDGDLLRVRSSCGPFGFGCSGRVRLVVPADVQVRVHSSAGAVRATGLTGTLDLSTSAGSVEGTDLGATQVKARSSAGSVRLRFTVEPSDVSASSSAGSVTVLVPQGTATYRVDASTSAGSESVDVRTDPASTRLVVVHSSAGSVRVGYTG